MIKNLETIEHLFGCHKARLMISIIGLALGFVLSPQEVVAGAGCKADLNNVFPSVARIANLSVPTCTGIVVNPHQIITAGHCLVKDGVSISPDRLKVHMSINGSDATLDVQAFHIHEKYEEYGIFDIAIIDLKEPAQAFTRIARDTLAQGDRLNIGGYGVQSISGYGPASTIRNMGENYVDLVDDYYLLLRPITISPGTKTVPIGSCIIFFGDSGGGVIRGNKTYAIQVTGTRTWERDGTIIHQDKLLRLDAPGVKDFLTRHLDASSWEPQEQ